MCVDEERRVIVEQRTNGLSYEEHWTPDLFRQLYKRAANYRLSYP